MRNNKLRQVFENLGFHNVRTVISSGNVLFDTDATDTKTLEAKIEKALPEQLDFTSTAIIRSKEQLQKLVNSNPFKNIEHSAKTHLNVTFLKIKPQTKLIFPLQPDKKGYTILNMYGQDICSVVDLTGARTPDLMLWLEKQFGREITTRTYKTVKRIVGKLNEG